MNKYKIKFRGLSEERHSYNFKINEDFFKQFPEAEIKKGNVLVDVEIQIRKDVLILDIELKGTVQVLCDRCLDNYYQNIRYSTKLFVEFGYENSDISDADNKIMLSKKEDELVLDKHFYDYIHLSLPYQRFHPEDENGNSECNIEMITKLDELSSEKKEIKIDPRWDKLKGLYN